MESNGSPSIEEQLREVKRILDEIDKVYEPLSAEINEVNSITKSIEDEYDAQIRAIQKEKANKIQVHREAQKAKQELAYQVNVKRRKLDDDRRRLISEREKALVQEQAQIESLLLDERWNKMLAGAPWREFAKDYQVTASKQWAQQKNMILADEMGLGKTLEAIMGLDYIRAATKFADSDNPYEADQIYTTVKNPDTNEWEKKYKWINGVERPCGIKVLYLCPSSLIKNVVSEFKHWAPHRSIVPIGNIPARQRDFVIEVGHEHNEFVMILNYEAWRFSIDTLINKLVKLNFDTVILDEAHNFKELRSKIYAGIKRFVENADVQFVMPMTGTPILNKPEELFPLLHVLDQNRYYSKKNFLNEFCQQRWVDSKWEFKPGGIKSLGIRLGRQYLRRTKKDIGIELPDQTVTIHDIPVDKETWYEQAKARKTMRENAMVILNSQDEFGNKKAITAAALIAMYTRLRQIETWPAGIVLRDQFGVEIDRLDVEESQKLDYVLTRGSYRPSTGEFADDGTGLLQDILENNQRVLVFSQFKAPLFELRDRVERAGYKAAVLTGETGMDERNAIARDFDKKFVSPEGYKYDIALCHYKVGGVGLNMTAATNTIILDEEWNPSKRDQAYARNHRIGQDEPVTVHVLRMENTIDDWLASIMENKEKLLEGFGAMGVPDIEKFFKDSDDSGLL